ncbi:MAG TPA: CopG family transcriptional regulator [Coxiellaceae bacterium]|nr:CopG family transcriptional regulator [Coxiellaceae bacterium]
MKKHKKFSYTDEPLGKVKQVNDFLPKPSELVLKEETVKITLSLSKESLDFFKKQASIHHTQYQKMIRNLLNHYVAHQKRLKKT